jgi:hypothetical protein
MAAYKDGCENMLGWLAYRARRWRGACAMTCGRRCSGRRGRRHAGHQAGGHKARREGDAPQSRWLPALRARRAFHEPGAETLAAEHLSAGRFDHRVHEWLLANRTHKVTVDVVVLIHEYLRTLVKKDSSQEEVLRELASFAVHEVTLSTSRTN